MFDSLGEPLQRSRGDAAIALDADGSILRLRQAGAAKAMLPRTHGEMPEAVFLNTSGGLTGGDRLSYAVDLAPGGRALATTQTAERAYASVDGPAEMAVRISVGAGARLDWLPQETILFDGSALHRQTEIDLGAGASCLFCEMLTLGRGAMGERLTRLDLFDRRVVTRDGVPVFVDPLRLTGFDLYHRGPAGLDGALALATIALVEEGAEDRLDRLRRILPPEAAASAWDGKLVIRAMADDPHRLRLALASILVHLRGGPMPRVWQV
ncbi:MAG: urease accessory protein UreD [Pseudomonadota bacterium]